MWSTGLKLDSSFKDRETWPWQSLKPLKEIKQLSQCVYKECLSCGCSLYAYDTGIKTFIDIPETSTIDTSTSNDMAPSHRKSAVTFDDVCICQRIADKAPVTIIKLNQPFTVCKVKTLYRRWPSYADYHCLPSSTKYYCTRQTCKQCCRW